MYGNQDNVSKELRYQISKEMFGGIIDEEYFELLRMEQNGQKITYRRIRWNSEIGGLQNLYYDISLYDTQFC